MNVFWEGAPGHQISNYAPWSNIFKKKNQVFCTPLGKYVYSSWLMGHASLVLKLNFGLTPLLLHLYAMEFCLKDNIDILV